MSGASPEVENLGGAPFGLSLDIRSGRSVMVDREMIEDNLLVDFPKLGASDWAAVQVHVTDAMPFPQGGLTIDLLPWRASRIARVLDFLDKKRWGFQEPFNRHRIWHTGPLEKLSQGRDILTLINIDAAEPKSPTVLPLSAHGPDFNMAHEFSHVVEALYERAEYLRDKEAHDQYHRAHARRQLGARAARLAVIATTADFIAGLGFNSAAMIDVGAAGGLTTIAALAVASTIPRDRRSLEERYNIKDVIQPYGSGEAAANSYALETQNRWEGCITIH